MTAKVACDPARREQFLKYLAYIFIGGLFIFLFKISWLKHGSLYVETFRDPWMVEEILRGKVVYRDLFYEYGFLPPYVLAGLCAAFGYHLNVFIFCGAALGLGCGMFIYRIVLLFISRFAATLTVSIFFIVFVFGQYYYQSIFNFILPYNFASLFLVLFSLAALFCFLRFIMERKVFYAYMWIAAMAMVFLSRPIVGAFIYLGFLLPWVVMAYKGFFRNQFKALAAMIAPVLAGILAYALFISVNHAWRGFNESIIQQTAVRSSGVDAGYALRSMGLDRPWFNFLVAVAVLYVAMACVVMLAFAASFFSKRNSFILGFLFFAASFAGGAFFLMNIDQYRYLPILTAGLALWYAYRAVVSGDSMRYVSLCAVFSLGFFMSLRIILNANPADCGFCFLAVALAGYYIFFFRIFNDFLAGKIKNFSPKLFNIFLVIFFIFTNSFYPVVSWAFTQKRTIPVIGSRGGIIVEDDRAVYFFRQVVEYLREHTDRKATVVAVPEISGINFFSERRNPLRYYSPTHTFLYLCKEEMMIGEFAAKKPDYVVMLSSKDCDHVGVDYGFKLNSWINDNYRVEKVFGDYPYHGKWSGGIAVLRRRADK
jgi:hypothetical protein